MALPTISKESESDKSYRVHRRFDRANRLFSEPGLLKLMSAHVMVVGVGGVGSFAAESLARSGVGKITLIDFDRVCITNSNRQLHTMQGTIGKLKVEVMAERLRKVHPTCEIVTAPEFYSAETADQLLSANPDYIIDAIDNMTAKAHLIATCRERKIPLVSCMGAASKLDPTQIHTADLSATVKDKMAKAVRKILRQQHGFGEGPFGIDAVFSKEQAIEPQVPSYDEGVGFRCVCPGGENGLNDCDKRRRIEGSASFVTGAFGLAATSLVVRKLIASA